MAGTTYSSLTDDIRNYTEVSSDVFTTAVINRFIEDAEEFYETVGTKTLRSNCILSNQKLLDSGVQIRNVFDAVRDSIDKWPPL